MKKSKIILSLVVVILLLSFQKANETQQPESLKTANSDNQTTILIEHLVPMSSAKKQEIRDAYLYHFGLLNVSYQFNQNGHREEIWTTASISQSELDSITALVFNTVNIPGNGNGTVGGGQNNSQADDDGPIITGISSSNIRLTIL